MKGLVVLSFWACGAPRVDPPHTQPGPLVASTPDARPADAVAFAESPVDASIDAPPARRARITFIHGAGGGRDPAAIAEQERRCDANDFTGCHALALALMSPGEPDSQNNKRAFAAFDKACKGHYAPSCNGLGVMYAEGLGVAQDEAKAIEIQIKACDDGAETACVHVAAAYESGQRGVAKSEAKSAEYYERACRLGGTPYCGRGKATK